MADQVIKNYRSELKIANNIYNKFSDNPAYEPALWAVIKNIIGSLTKRRNEFKSK